MKAGFIAEQGERSRMEDACCLYPDFAGQGTIYGGVYDGHGGDYAAKYVAQTLPFLFLQRYRAGVSPVEAFLQSYEVVSADLDGQDSGTTAVDFFITGPDIFVANVGDSRAIVVKKEGHRRLTVDHRLDDDGERARVAGTGAKIVYPYLFRGLQGLMTTRSLGDRYFRPAGVIPTPSTNHHIISADDLLLIAASDGLWDFMSDEEVCVAARKLVEPDDLLAALREEVLNARTGTDNLAIIAVSLH